MVINNLQLCKIQIVKKNQHEKFNSCNLYFWNNMPFSV